ncbi:hypothetical protein Godav_022109 [Gossypium davidsonii]|uniref:Uncharacterized protein n=1 Tax=Gossypium davidsonii TaxID=34287 RepID=A0A7J8TI94_GOSDV|nr:hypothetical protein [Gossypium davidsonii]
MLASVRRPSRREAMESQRCRIHQQHRKPIGGLNRPLELLDINKQLLDINKRQGKHWCDDSINHHETGPTKSLEKCRRGPMEKQDMASPWQTKAGNGGTIRP